MLRIVCSVWAVTPPSTTTPSRIPPWPDTMMKSPARTNGEYGPNGLFMEPRLGGAHSEVSSVTRRDSRQEALG